MHIVYPLIRVADNFSNGGIARVVSQRAYELARRGHQVTILSSFEGSNQIPGVALKHVPLRKRSPQSVPVLNDLLHGRALARMLGRIHNESPVDFVDVQEPNIALPLYKASKKAQIGTFFTIHLSVLVGPQRFSRFRTSVYRHFNVSAAKNALHSIAVSEYIRQAYVRALKDPSKVSVVYNPIDTGIFKFTPRQPAQIQKVLWLGRMVANKGLPEILEFASKFTTEHKNITFTFAGDGPLRAILAPKYAQNPNIVFAGSAAGPQAVAALMASHDIFLFSSDHETASMTVLEAMACGTPVIASGIPPVREILDDCGLYYSNYNDDQIAAAIQTLLDSPEQAASLTRKAKERVDSWFTIEKTTGELLSLYEAHL